MIISPLLYRKTGNSRAVQLLLGHTKFESTVRYLAGRCPQDEIMEDINLNQSAKRKHTFKSYLWAPLTFCFGACTSTMVTAPVGLPPQPSPAELERNPVWLANCIVALEITARDEHGAPDIANGPALSSKWRASLEKYIPDQIVRATRLATTRQEWAGLLDGKSAEQRFEELDSMVSVCGGR